MFESPEDDSLLSRHAFVAISPSLSAKFSSSGILGANSGGRSIITVAAAKSLADGWSRNIGADTERCATGKGSRTWREVRPEPFPWYDNGRSSWSGGLWGDFWGG